MTVYLLQGTGTKQSAVATALHAAIPDLTEIGSLEAVLKSGAKRAERAERPIVLIILPPGDTAVLDRLIKIAALHGSGAFFIVISDDIPASDYKRLLRIGNADWASAKAASAEVVEIIARRRTGGDHDAAPPRAGRRPVTISFVPSAGGVGNTTLLLETAAHIKSDKATRQRKICLVDLDFQTSHICDYLDSEPRLQIAELSGAPDRLDDHLFESFKTRHASEIDVFAAPRSKYRSEELNIDALDTLFGMIARRYDLVLIDYPVTWFSWTPQIIAASDGAVVTGVNTIPALRQVSETLALVRSSGSAALQIAVAINRCERTMLGAVARRKHVETVLSDERLFFIGTRPEAVESVNMGMPMMLGASAAKSRKDFAPLVGFCAALQPQRWATV
jgi:pilus assembly protein CpaE